jgi:sporulation protein YlmC with PRC-barrel domain
MQTARYFRLALLGATLLSTPVLAATNDQATNPPPANNTAATAPAPAHNMAATMTPAANNPNNANNTAATNPPADNMAANNGKGPDGVLHKYDNEWRASKLVGANVYNEQGKVVASINDLLVADDGHIDRAVLSTGGGILGVGAKLVTVPFSQLKFQPSVNNNTTGNAVAVNNANNNAPLPKTEAPVGNGNPNGNAATTANSQTAPTNSTMVAANNNNSNVNNNNNPENFSIVLPGATEDSLKNEQEFKYAAD